MDNQTTLKKINRNGVERIAGVVLKRVVNISDIIAKFGENSTRTATSELTNEKENDFPYNLTLSRFQLNYTVISTCKNSQYISRYSEMFHPEIIPPPPQL